MLSATYNAYIEKNYIEEWKYKNDRTCSSNYSFNGCVKRICVCTNLLVGGH